MFYDKKGVYLYIDRASTGNQNVVQIQLNSLFHKMFPKFRIY